MLADCIVFGIPPFDLAVRDFHELVRGGAVVECKDLLADLVATEVREHINPNPVIESTEGDAAASDAMSEHRLGTTVKG